MDNKLENKHENAKELNLDQLDRINGGAAFEIWDRENRSRSSLTESCRGCGRVFYKKELKDGLCSRCRGNS